MIYILGPDSPYQPLTSHEAAGRRSRSSNGRQVRPPGTEHPPRAILAVHEADHLNHLVRRSSHLAELILQLAKMVSLPSFSTGLALRAASMACARKAHKVKDDGGAEACSSTPLQAACPSTMVTLQPLLGSLIPGTRSRPWPSGAARLRRAAAAWSKRYDQLLRHGAEGADGLGSLGLSNRVVGASTGRAWTGDGPRVANVQTGKPRGRGV